MGRSGYNDDCDGWALIRWRGAVASAIRGKRGQAFLREMVAALNSLPEKILIREELENDGRVCALGSVGKARGIDMTDVDSYDRETMAELFGIPEALAAEIMYENDECERIIEDGAGGWRRETDAERWQRVHKWVEGHLASAAGEQAGGAK